MIAIIDYGMGNLRSVQKAFEKVGAKAVITDSVSAIENAEKIVLPGVGAFAQGIEELKNRDLFDLIIDLVKNKKPYLGLCLGLQFLFQTSQECGKGTRGLGLIKGEVKLFPRSVKIPHMGWNQIEISKNCPFFKGIENNSYVYFVHSYYVDPKDQSIVSSWTDYGNKFASSIYKDNIFATQFHPEKSQDEGLKVIENFVKHR